MDTQCLGYERTGVSVRRESRYQGYSHVHLVHAPALVLFTTTPNLLGIQAYCFLDKCKCGRAAFRGVPVTPLGGKKEPISVCDLSGQTNGHGTPSLRYSAAPLPTHLDGCSRGRKLVADEPLVTETSRFHIACVEIRIHEVLPHLLAVRGTRHGTTQNKRLSTVRVSNGIGKRLCSKLKAEREAFEWGSKKRSTQYMSRGAGLLKTERM